MVRSHSCSGLVTCEASGPVVSQALRKWAESCSACTKGIHTLPPHSPGGHRQVWGSRDHSNPSTALSTQMTGPVAGRSSGGTEQMLGSDGHKNGSKLCQCHDDLWTFSIMHLPPSNAAHEPAFCLLGGNNMFP